MRSIILCIVLLALTFSCGNKNGLFMQTNSTIKIDADDTKDSIIVKAAYIVPTKNQYEALKNEFIAFVHFGPNTFTQKGWGDNFEDPKIFNLQPLMVKLAFILKNMNLDGNLMEKIVEQN